MKWSSDSRALVGGMVLALVILVAVGLVSYRTASEWVQAAAARDREHRVIENLQLLLTELDDAETGQRGYLITGEPRYLQPYDKALGTVSRTVQALDGLTALHPQQHERLRSLQPLIDAKLAELQETIRLRREQGIAPAQAAVLNDKGRQIMDDIRRLVAQMDTRAEGLLAETDREVQTSARRNRLVLVIGDSVSIGLLLLVFYLLSQEVSTRKRAEGRFRESEQKLSLLIQGVKDYAIVMLDPEGKVASWSEGAHRIKGYDADEVMGRHFSIFYPQEDIKASSPQKHLETAAALGRSEDEGLRVRKDGKVFWASVVITAIRDDLGRLRGFAKVTRDITEGKRTEEQLRAQASLLDIAHDSIMVRDLSGLISFWNQGAEATYGWSRDQAVGQVSHALLQTRFPQPLEEIDATLLRERLWEGELDHTRSDGSRIIVLSRWVLQRDERGRPARVLETNNDITERKRTEERIQRLNANLENRTRELEATNKELEAFTYSVSHDLRSPLRHIDGFSKLLVEDFGQELSEDARKYLTRIREGTRQMGQLVDDLLNLARVGRRELKVQLTGLDNLVAEVLSDLKSETTTRKIDWKVERLPFVECDAALMKQVFANLLSNAVKYTRPRDRATIEVGVRTENGQPAVFVRDNGVGFSMKYADKLFGVFQRLHRPEDFEGTGVGLATVQRIIHKHGGRVWAEAEIDRGATFYFTLGGLETIQEEKLAA
jgi:PAS domain S-box-containing protein